ncbi:MAG: hypothetical protein P4L85_00220 [Paludisphaera borealis]|uniref:hypothetical protein n=1 Tax=Paludisphaera borealis TaxID=1387353 RepID=UPI002840C09D|nr:hypothetical protein [Paludisphaera borealis]MDR3617749.1 hypothetical protein [Paludisphaera borealis]
MTAATLSLFAGWSTHADTIALSTTGGFSTSSSGDQLWGWQFGVNSNIDVTSLGIFDTRGDGLAVAHDVGIFRVSDKSLVGSITLPDGTGGVLLDGFRYYSLGSSLALAAGEQYVIAMTMRDGNADSQYVFTNPPTTAPEITYVDSRFDNASNLAFPTFAGPVAPGIFGPNFLFNDGSAVPEPSTLVMGLIPVLLSLAASRRRSLARNAA